MPRSIKKSAATGLIVSDAEAEADPDGTYAQTTHPKQAGGMSPPSRSAGRTFDQRFGVGKVPKGKHEDRLYAWRSRVYAVAGDIHSSVHNEERRGYLLASLEQILVEVQKDIEEADGA